MLEKFSLIHSALLSTLPLSTMIISADFTEDNEFKHALVKSSLFQIGIIIDVRIIFFIFFI